MANIDVEPVDRVEDDEEDAHDGHGAPDDSTELSVDVEARTTDETDLPDRVDAPEYVLYGGKGGVGKTTMAAATALSSAATGTATLVVSTDPAHSLSDTLGVEVPADPSRVREDIPLYAAEIDPDEVIEGPFASDEGTGGFDAVDLDADDNPFEDDTDDGFGDETATDNPFGGQNGQNPFGMDMGGMEDVLGDMMGPGSMPGADEAAAMQQLVAYLDDPRFDRVVVDTAPTGHTLRLLELPELMDSMLGRIARMRQKFSGMMDNIKGMFGAGNPNQAGMGDLDELRERIERLRAVLRDPQQTDFRVVMIPEEMSVVESKRLIDRLDGYGIPVQTLVVNRVMENLADVTTTPVDSEWVVSPNLDECEFCQRRWTVQQNALQRATDLFRGRNVKRVPLLADEVSGEDALRVVAACLA
ncbi:arsenite efflux ATP-binding protein arsa [Halogeometricum borinquense DSM 11551]|uniref:Arsenite efflux ATP-binding protein ArsA n=1 Tax=Halogeometricum borinquense (strain ATCC 700274 / DSM 11551 / JCM 10706 / KCTC 4070 / PR3) TaxID=469382 RepID=E4NS01_HALBP|nr:TRC40/GET3/ArsA family transport-energizing ATPase [Halogeometricum borinquense]ADQ68047.1 arsenite efflux ATP-binding protein ArsA [Halogeometricum borinquense DSM 11551]ELY24395.1 arsenite efflux ATP-binding protein arsa [Halogeometricum borinquense DSM 11551]